MILGPVNVYILAGMIFLTVFSNACSIIAITQRRRKISRMYFFLLNLSIADLLNAVMTLGPELFFSLNGTLLLDVSDPVCKVIKYLQMVAPYLRYVTYFPG